MIVYIAAAVVLIIIIVIAYFAMRGKDASDEETPSGTATGGTTTGGTTTGGTTTGGTTTGGTTTGGTTTGGTTTGGTTTGGTTTRKQLPDITTKLDDKIMWDSKPDAVGFYKYRCNGLYFREDPVFKSKGWCIYVVNISGQKYGVLSPYEWEGDGNIKVSDAQGGSPSSWSGFGMYCVPSVTPIYRPLRGTVEAVVDVLPRINKLRSCQPDNTDYVVNTDVNLYKRIFRNRNKNIIEAFVGDTSLWSSKPEAQGTYVYASDGLFFRSTPKPGENGWCIFVADVSGTKYGIITTYGWSADGKIAVNDGLGSKPHSFMGYGFYCVDQSLPIYKPEKKAELENVILTNPRRCPAYYTPTTADKQEFGI